MTFVPQSHYCHFFLFANYIYWTICMIRISGNGLWRRSNYINETVNAVGSQSNFNFSLRQEGMQQIETVMRQTRHLIMFSRDEIAIWIKPPRVTTSGRSAIRVTGHESMRIMTRGSYSIRITIGALIIVTRGPFSESTLLHSISQWRQNSSSMIFKFILLVAKIFSKCSPVPIELVSQKMTEESQTYVL